MAEDRLTFNIGKVMRGVTIKIKIKGIRIFKFRLWLGCQIMKLGAFVIGMPIEIDSEAKGE